MAFQHGLELKAAAATLSTYVGGGVVVINSWTGFLTVLDDHSGAFGVMFVALTYLTNFMFKIFDRRQWSKDHAYDPEHNRRREDDL